MDEAQMKLLMSAFSLTAPTVVAMVGGGEPVNGRSLPLTLPLKIKFLKTGPLKAYLFLRYS